jgi:hypothetical protein
MPKAQRAKQQAKAAGNWLKIDKTHHLTVFCFIFL